VPLYFETLQRAQAEEGESPVTPLDAAERARSRALEAAFGSVDLDELDRAWREFVRSL